MSDHYIGLNNRGLVQTWRDYVESMGSVIGDAEQIADALCSALDRAEADKAEAMRDGIIKGMHIAVTTPIEQVPEAIAAAIRALPRPPALPASPDVQALVEALRNLLGIAEDEGIVGDKTTISDARAALAPFTGAKP